MVIKKPEFVQEQLKEKKRTSIKFFLTVSLKKWIKSLCSTRHSHMFSRLKYTKKKKKIATKNKYKNCCVLDISLYFVFQFKSRIMQVIDQLNIFAYVFVRLFFFYIYYYFLVVGRYISLFRTL